ncbi:MAG: helicase-associated domain-containing protein, partial [Desulfobacterales bacterium]|nr:helicase-associated domain-containing protein [Desulfobacterales bacterium]
MNDSGPLIVQSDHTIMVEVAHPQYVECRDFLNSFAELVKSPEFIHTYRVTPLSLWNSAALETGMDEITNRLIGYSRYEIPSNVLFDIREWYETYGSLVLEKVSENSLRLRISDSIILNRIRQDNDLERFWLKKTEDGFLIAAGERGNLKHALVKI